MIVCDFNYLILKNLIIKENNGVYIYDIVYLNFKDFIWIYSF